MRPNFQFLMLLNPFSLWKNEKHESFAITFAIIVFKEILIAITLPNPLSVPSALVILY